jgi:hypothetical protein
MFSLMLDEGRNVAQIENIRSLCLRKFCGQGVGINQSAKEQAVMHPWRQITSVYLDVIN